MSGSDFTDAATLSSAAGQILTADEWHARRDRHRRRVEDVIGPYLRDRRRGQKHPVLDFLFTYYSSRPAHIERYHPGYGVVLLAPSSGRDDTAPYEALRGYQRMSVETGATQTSTRPVEDAGDAHGSPTGVGVGADYLCRRHTALRETKALLAATASRPPRFGCFGLHEWAMVYRTDAPRHDLPLRLGAAGTDAVVESMPLRCTHFDAFRFFTDDARPRNEFALTTADRLTRDQPGCLHTTMDLYRTTMTLTPLLDSELTLRAFELVRDARELDMRASPYDLGDLGYSPVPVETPAGRATYIHEQTALAERGATLRAEIESRIDTLLSVAMRIMARADASFPASNIGT